MIKNINVCQNIQIPEHLAFKSRQDGVSVTSPIENTNLNGTSALASYNSSLVKDKFNIPLLRPIQIPNDINAIEGERIYNSKGILQCIVKDVGDKKYVYSQNSNDFPGINNVRIYDKKTGNIIFEQNEFKTIDDKGEHQRCWIEEYDTITGLKTSSTEYDDKPWTKPLYKDMCSYKADGSYDSISYNYDSGTYSVHGYDVQTLSSYEKTYNANKNLIGAYYDELTDNSTRNTVIKYHNGKEVSKNVQESQAIYNPELQEYLKNPNLKPAECPEFITNIDNIEGEKTYYSNGQLESVKTADGKLYEISFDGNCIILYDKNKKIDFTVDHFSGEKHCTINENFGEDEKETRYSGKNGNKLSYVSYTNGSLEKRIVFVNNKPSSYSEYDNSEEDWAKRWIIDIDFAPNGGILDVRRREDFN